MALTEQEISARLRLRDQATFVRQSDQARDAIKRLNSELERSTKSGKIASSAWSGVRKGIAGVVGLASRGVGILAGAATVAGGAFVRLGVTTNATWETNTMAFKTMLGSGKQAIDMMARLEKFAIATPFEMPQLVTSARYLRAMGFEANQLIPLMKVIGDSAAALGQDSQGLERIARAFGEMRAKGYPAGEEMRQLANHGIRAWQYLADYIGKSIPETMKLAQKRQISAAQGISGILAGMARDHGNTMDALMHTTLGRWYELKDSMRRASRLAVQPFMGDIQHMISWVTAHIDPFTKWIQTKIPLAFSVFKYGFAGGKLEGQLGNIQMRFFYLGRTIRALFGKDGGDRWKQIRTGIKGIIDPAHQFSGWFDKIGDTAIDVWKIFSQGLLPVWTSMSPLLKALITPMSIVLTLLGFLADHTWLVRTATVAFIAVLAGYKVWGLYTRGIIAAADAMEAWKAKAALTADATRLLKNAVIDIRLRMMLAKDVLMRWGTALANTAVGTKLVAIATWLWNAALDANPVVLIVGGLVALGVILYFLYRRFKLVRDIVHLVWKAIKMLANPLGAVVSLVGGLFGGGHKEIKADVNTKVSGKLPGAANGGVITSGGYLMVGERGPEVVRLPEAASVHPLDNRTTARQPEYVPASAQSMPARLEVTDGGRRLFDIVINERLADKVARS